MPLAERVLAYLEVAEKKESDPWLRDDLRIAWLTVRWAWSGVPAWSWHKDSRPYVAATFQVLRCHPDEVWTRILAARRVNLGPEYSRFYPDIPHNKKQPMAESREGDAPQKTCAYGAANDSKLAETSTPKGADVEAARIVDTGSSCRTETKREARRALTSEFGLNDAPPAGVAAPAEIPSPRKPCASERNPRWRKAA